MTQARARPADVGGTTAIYLRIQNDSDSGGRLVGVASPIGSAEMHTSIDDGGIMRMRSTEAVDLPSRGEVRFEPGGLHIMVSELQQTLVAGDEITLTLHFERVGQLQVQVPVVS